MSIKTQIKKLEQYEVQHRSAFERIGAFILTIATVFSMTELGHTEDKRNFNRAREAVVAQAIVFNPAEKNETVRMPVKFDDGLRATATTSA